MNIYKYWKKEKTEISVRGQKQFIFCFGRSNVSMDEAARDALARAKKVEMKVAGKNVLKKDYVADIREETIRSINERNVITRNRYGALVLNTESVMIIDIDQHKKTFFEWFGFAKREKKAAILEDLGKVSKRPEYTQLGLRVYETHSGVRVIVTGRYYDPTSKAAKTLLELCHSDRLYTTLCQKQKCYRARLTPKPHRMNQKAIKYNWPMDEAEREKSLLWLDEYQKKSEGYATCRYLKTIGKELPLNEIISHHDQETKANSTLPLA